MIDRADLICELTSQEPSKKWHQRLKSAKEKRNDKTLLFVDLAHGKTLANRHGKCVHSKSYAHQHEFNKSHITPFF